MKAIFNWVKSLFSKRKNYDGLIGYWGVWDSNTEDPPKIKGEMYSFNGEWIAGPEVYEGKEIESL